MNTPSHAILNLVLLSQLPTPAAGSAILLGAILPDVPIFAMYFWEKLVRRECDRTIWTEIYWRPDWQRVVAIFHSFPLAAIATTLAYFLHWQFIQILGVSLILHSLLDLPFHNDDAHRHFFPLSNYRFISPISYWDPRHHGQIVSLMERILVLIATIYLFPMIESNIGRGMMILVNVLYFGSYVYFWARRKRAIAGVINQCESQTGE